MEYYSDSAVKAKNVRVYTKLGEVGRVVFLRHVRLKTHDRILKETDFIIKVVAKDVFLRDYKRIYGKVSFVDQTKDEQIVYDSVHGAIPNNYEEVINREARYPHCFAFIRAVKRRLKAAGSGEIDEIPRHCVSTGTTEGLVEEILTLLGLEVEDIGD